ncbi:lactonase family protein [Cupriavidus sp. LEh25]|nr:lactonase family protein [Cupriavidus sp. LEh25]
MPGVHAHGAEQKPMYAYVGCRTTKARNARGKGINVYRVREDGWEHVQLMEGLDNPSFLAMDRAQRYLYAVHGDLGDISAFAIDATTGRLTLLNRQGTEGKNPVHLAVEPGNRFIVVANYATGSLVTLPIQADGSLGRVADLAKLPGNPGSNREQQGGSHPHDVPFDIAGRHFIVPDKGVDRVFAFSVDSRTGKLTPASSPYVEAPAGAGPRHVTFHPARPLAYVINELNSTVTTYQYDEASGALSPLQTVSTVPKDYGGDNTGAEIQIANSGKFLYASNRGHDSIVTMGIDPTSGLLTPLSWVESRGKGPRFFAIDPDGRRLYAANELSDTIVPFDIARESGKLTPLPWRIDTGSPVCVAFRRV